MPTAQDRSRVGAQMKKRDRNRLGRMAHTLRNLHVTYRDADDESALLDLADQLDQAASPIVIEEGRDR